jgi:polysaccharide export outer membrane protein
VLASQAKRLAPFSQRYHRLHQQRNAAVIAHLPDNSNSIGTSSNRRRLASRLARIAASLGFAAMLSPLAAESQELAANVRPLLELGIGDVLNMQVYGRPELTTTTYIADDGTMAIPLAGPVAIAGLSPATAAQEIAAAFRKEQILRNPQVTLLLMQSRSQQVSVLGEVRTPGRFAVESTTNLLDLLAAAGGTSERSADTIFVIRADETGNIQRHPVNLKGLQDPKYSLQFPSLRGGDTVFVPPAAQFYIYGEVLAPNMYRLEPQMTVLQAISRSGGLTALATTRRIEIKRRTADGTTVTGKVALTELVQPDDVIYVREARF